MMIYIRQASDCDYMEIGALVAAAFADVAESDHTEHLLVERLHRSDTYIPQLSLVAETDNGQIVGYILLTEMELVTPQGVLTTLGVAPLAVLPAYQQQGVGGMLLMKAHAEAVSLGYESAVLLGHKDYYPRFGYRRAADFGIRFPFDAPDECCMAIELVPGALAGVGGMVRYPDAFFG